MTPQLIAFYEGALYARLAAVLAHTAARQCATWDRQIRPAALYTHGETTIEQRVRRDLSKLRRWTQAVDEAPDDTPMLLIDCDTMILRPLDAVWDAPFDVAITMRDPARTPLPLNAGVVFVRATAAARRFLRLWADRAEPIRHSIALMRQARKRYGAADQAGLAQLLDQPAATAGVTIQRLPCQVWNSEDSEWGRVSPETRIVHIKGALRKAVLGQPISEARKPSVLPLAAQWRTYEHEARA